MCLMITWSLDKQVLLANAGVLSRSVFGNMGWAMLHACMSYPSDFLEINCRPSDDINSVPLVLHRIGSRCFMEPYSVYNLQLRPGFLAATRAILKLKENALSTIGLPCSSYVFLNTGTSRRSAENPFGETSLEYIQAANKHPGMAV